MLTLMRLTGMALVLICTLGILVCTSGAEVMTAYSGQYTTALEQKQMLLGSISEDALRTEAQVKNIVEKGKSIQDDKVSHLSIDRIDLAEIMPESKRINIALPFMSNTLAPEITTHARDHEDTKTRQ